MKNINRLLAVAVGMIRKGQLKQAQRKLFECAKLCRNRVWTPEAEKAWIKVHYNYACSLSLQGKTGEALEALKEALKWDFTEFKALREDKDLENVRNDYKVARELSRLINQKKAAIKAQAFREAQAKLQLEEARQAAKARKVARKVVKSKVAEAPAPVPTASVIRKVAVGQTAPKKRSRIVAGLKRWGRRAALAASILGAVAGVGYGSMKAYNAFSGQAVAQVESEQAPILNSNDSELVLFLGD